MIEVPLHVDAALRYIDSELSRVMWNITQHEWVSPFSNSGNEFIGKTFKVLAYDWNEKRELNFEWQDYKISWYKYLGRGMQMNKPMTPRISHKMLIEITNELRKRDVDLMKNMGDPMRKPQGIDIKSLTESDKYRYVLYLESYIGEGRKAEPGWISSWNDHFVFVRYNQGETSAATRPEDLEFIDNL